MEIDATVTPKKALWFCFYIILYSHLPAPCLSQFSVLVYMANSTSIYGIYTSTKRLYATVLIRTLTRKLPLEISGCRRQDAEDKQQLRAECPLGIKQNQETTIESRYVLDQNYDPKVTVTIRSVNLPIHILFVDCLASFCRTLIRRPVCQCSESSSHACIDRL